MKFDIERDLLETETRFILTIPDEEMNKIIEESAIRELVTRKMKIGTDKAVEMKIKSGD